MRDAPLWADPVSHISRFRPDTAQLYFAPGVLQATARRFQAGFDGVVTYAVKANAGEEVLANLISAGISAFDVASPREMYAVRKLSSEAVLHYHNPVRSGEEIEVARALGVQSYSVDCLNELDKLGALPIGTEISVRLALPIEGAAYHFGEKFGVGEDGAIALLKEVAARGLTASMTFHPGTQCTDASAWVSYIGACADIARQARVDLYRLNVGGGFAAHREGAAPDLERVFEQISAARDKCFPNNKPILVCEPGRAMVADAFSLASRIKALRADGSVFLNDGVYGGLFEARDMPMGDRVSVVDPAGVPRRGNPQERILFGPTCDSLDRLPDPMLLPHDLAEGDYVLFAGMGAYSRSLSTGFNGYGLGDPVTVASL